MKHLIFFLLLFCWVSAMGQFPNIDSLINQAEQLEGKKKALMYADISYYAAYSNTDLSLEYADKSLELAKTTKDSLLIAEGYNAFAIAWYMRSFYPLALEYNMKALDIRLRLGDDYSRLSSYSKIGNCLHEMGRYDEAISYYLKGLKISEDNKHTRQTGLISNNIAEIFKSQENYEKAREYYVISIQIATELNDTLGLCKALINQGVSYKSQWMFQKADSLFKKAYSLVEGQGFTEVEAGLMNNFGTMYKAWGQAEKSLQYYKRAEHLYRQSGEIFGLSLAYTNLGNTYLELGQSDTALFYYTKGLELSKTTNSLARMAKAYEGMTNYYRQLGNYRKAFGYDSISDMLRDSIFNIEKSRAIEELNTQYETGKKEKLLAEQKVTLALQELKVQQRNMQLLGAVGSLFLLLLIAILIYRGQKNKHVKLQQQLALERAEAVNKIQDEKLRISRDLHDNIGSQLTFVISSLDNMNYLSDEDKRKEKLAMLGGYTRETMAQLRETIWALNSESISQDQLISKVAGLIKQAKLTWPEIKFRIESSPSDKELLARQAINLFRLVQEAINNAIKYSGAKNIVFESSPLTIAVKDDGRGFDRESISGGQGLKNMKARMEEIGFGFSINSKPGSGTEILVQLG
jgi:signal transduction histidine kinase